MRERSVFIEARSTSTKPSECLLQRGVLINWRRASRFPLFFLRAGAPLRSSHKQNTHQSVRAHLRPTAINTTKTEASDQDFLFLSSRARRGTFCDGRRGRGRRRGGGLSVVWEMDREAAGRTNRASGALEQANMFVFEKTSERRPKW